LPDFKLKVIVTTHPLKIFTAESAENTEETRKQRKHQAIHKACAFSVSSAVNF